MIKVTMAQFPTLFGASAAGKVMQWHIEVLEHAEGGLIRVQRGYEGGKIQTAEKIISQGKNIGKSNETTALQQAVSEARSQWQKKRDEKYVPREEAISVPNAADAPKSRAAAVDDTVPSPMLAHDYNKRGKSIVYPCFIQPKLDGTRMVAMPGLGLFSRNRKAYPHLEHIRAEIDKLPKNIILDGELYSDTLTFQEIVGLVKNETIQPKQLQIMFHVYDIISAYNFETRYIMLKGLFEAHKFQHLVLTKTEQCATEDAMKQKHNEYVADGYEGIMLRNKTGLYSNARSVHLQKYKEFFDEECHIVGFKEGEGAEAGCVIWLCEIDGKQFACRPRGTREERQELFRNGDEYVGKLLTVRYQEKTDDGLLRFPVGLAIRDYE